MQAPLSHLHHGLFDSKVFEHDIIVVDMLLQDEQREESIECPRQVVGQALD